MILIVQYSFLCPLLEIVVTIIAIHYKMYVRVGAVAFLIILTGTVVLGIESLFGEIRGNSVRVIAILSSIASVSLLFQTNTLKGMLSGYGPFDSEALTFDTKFEDVHINGRISGNIQST